MNKKQIQKQYIAKLSPAMQAIYNGYEESKHVEEVSRKETGFRTWKRNISK
jgi:hypothetical protein